MITLFLLFLVLTQTLSGANTEDCLEQKNAEEIFQQALPFIGKLRCVHILYSNNIISFQPQILCSSLTNLLENNTESDLITITNSIEKSAVRAMGAPTQNLLICILKQGDPLSGPPQHALNTKRPTETLLFFFN